MKTERPNLHALRGSDLADLFQVSIQRIGQHVREGLPRQPDGSFDLREVADWFKRRWQTTARADSPLATARIRETEARTARLHHELAHLKSQLIYRSDAEDLLTWVNEQVSAELSVVASRFTADQKLHAAVSLECKSLCARLEVRRQETLRALRLCGRTHESEASLGAD